MRKPKRNPLLVNFGNLVRKARTFQNMSQEELGFKVGLHRTYIGMIERAERNISFIQAISLIQFLNLKIEDLYDISICKKR